MSMGTTFSAYKSMQTEIDKAMPDQIMTIQGRQFRRKGYWRAVRAAFQLKVTCAHEERIEIGGDWGYSVLYRAEGRNGMGADGDGVCMAAEKIVFQKDWSTKPPRFMKDSDGNRVIDVPKTQENQTVHNVRGHAHTRAFNRAVSNLVGFGEVSAEEVERDDHPVTVTAQYAPSIPAAKVGTVAPVETAPFELGNDEDNSPIEAESVPEGFVTIKDVVEKHGESARGPWTLFLIKFSDGREASTFDGQLSVQAKAAQASKTPVIPTLMPGKKAGSWNLVSMVRA